MEAVHELKQANEDKAAKEQQCAEWKAEYEKNKEKRTKEINVVKQVENIIATKLETMKDYISDRPEEAEEAEEF